MSAIQAALDEKLSAWATSESISVAWPNVVAATILDAPFVESFLLPAETVPVGMADNSANDFIGVYQVNVNTAKGAGTEQARSLVESLLAEFSRGSMAGDVRIERSYYSQSFSEGAWFMVPVTIRYRCFG